MAHTVGGKNSKDVFKDRTTRRLADAACKGERRRIEELAKSGADINGQGFQGATPLLWAISCENETGVKALLDQGADPNQKSKNDITAVTTAATYKNSSFLKMVLEAGGDPNAEEITNTGFRSALKLAFAMGVDTNNWDKYYELLDVGADINRTSPYGNQGTIGTYALIFGRYCKIKELLKRGYNHELVSLLVVSFKTGAVATESNELCRHELIERLRNKLSDDDIQADIDNYAERLKLPPEKEKEVLEKYSKMRWAIYRDEISPEDLGPEKNWQDKYMKSGRVKLESKSKEKTPD